MSLKCPICGKEYYYDSKICQICENESNDGGLINYDEDRTQRWNCGVFLEFDTLAFGAKKPDEAYIKIATEPKFFDIKAKEEHPWNCNSRFRTNNFYILGSGSSQIGSFEKLSAKISTTMEKEKSSLLIYE